jgi:predicted RNA binding protein YcfA (HicA-like mRNA interferase family)
MLFAICDLRRYVLNKNMPKLKIIRIPGKTILVEMGKGKTLKSILDSAGIAIDFSSQALYIDNTRISEKDIDNICNINSDIVIAMGAKGQAPTPKMKNVIKHIISLGYKENGGKGDHRKFTNPDGKMIVLNADKNDHKHLDLGSSK